MTAATAALYGSHVPVACVCHREQGSGRRRRPPKLGGSTPTSNVTARIHLHRKKRKSETLSYCLMYALQRCSGGGGNRTSRSCINSRICVVALARFLYGCCRLYRLLPPIFALRPVVNFARAVLSLNQWLANYPLCICLCLREGDRKKGTSARLIIARTIVRSSGWRCCCRSSS